MVAIAIFSVDPVLRGNLEQLPREDPAITIVGFVDSPLALLELAETHHVDVVLAETLPSELLTDQQVRHQQTAWVNSRPRGRGDQPRRTQYRGIGHFASNRQPKGNSHRNQGGHQRACCVSAATPRRAAAC